MTIDVEESQGELRELVSSLRAGTEILLTEGGRPVARLVPVDTAAGTRIAGLNRDSIWTSDDFDSPLPDEFWTGAG